MRREQARRPDEGLVPGTVTSSQLFFRCERPEVVERPREEVSAFQELMRGHWLDRDSHPASPLPTRQKRN